MVNKILNKRSDRLKEILFNKNLFAIAIKDNGFESYNINGSKYYTNVEIALFQIIEWVFDNHGIYLSIQLGEDSLDVKWWTCNFKYKDEIKSFYSEKNYEAVLLAFDWIEEQQNV